MSGELSLRNRQRTRRIDARLLRQIVNHLLKELLQLKEFDLTVNLIGETEMTTLNESVLHHAGSTDVITFDYSELILVRGARPPRAHSRPPRPRSSASANLPPLCGELFICIDEALLQARRFRVTWQAEMVRYIVHGVLHLRGHDDLRATPRRLMKREENRLVKELSSRFGKKYLQNN